MESGASGPVKEVVFCPCMARYWDRLAGLFAQYAADDHTAVCLVVLPWFEKAADGTLLEMHYEADLFPADIPVTHYEHYDFSTLRPDTIIIQHPYDAWHDTMSVHPAFYAEELRKYTEHLVCVPYVRITPPEAGDARGYQTLQYFVTVPGVFAADETLVPDERIRQTYIDALSAYAGEETRARWEKQIVVRACGEETGAESIWEETGEAQKEAASEKRRVLFTITLSTLLEYGERAVKKLGAVLDIMREYESRVTFVWRADPLIGAHLPSWDATLYASYRALEERFEREHLGESDVSQDVYETAAACHAFYGDPSEAMRACRERKLPVMQMDVNV